MADVHVSRLPPVVGICSSSHQASAIVFLAACEDVGGPIQYGATSTLQVVHGADQTGVVQSRLESPITFETAAPHGDPFPATIRVILVGEGFIDHENGDWAYGTGQSIEVHNATAATVVWVLGGGIGSQRLRAIAYQPGEPNTDSLEAIVKATATRDELNNIVQHGNSQVGNAGETLARPLGIELTDRWGNGYCEIVVRWSVLSREGNLSTDSTSTDWFGEASVEWVLGNAVEPQSVIASIEGVGDLLFTATAR